MTKKELLIEFANALERAAALAREIAEREPETVTIKLDADFLSRAVYKANRDNLATCESLTADQGQTSPEQGAPHLQDSEDQS